MDSKNLKSRQSIKYIFLNIVNLALNVAFSSNIRLKYAFLIRIWGFLNYIVAYNSCDVIFQHNVFHCKYWFLFNPKLFNFFFYNILHSTWYLSMQFLHKKHQNKWEILHLYFWKSFIKTFWSYKYKVIEGTRGFWNL